jgi:hypothetical protein
MAFEAAEFDRLNQINACLKKFCELERNSIEFKTKLLIKLEDAVNSVKAEADLGYYIAQEKRAELTHKFSKALSILDWDFHRRYDDTECDICLLG